MHGLERDISGADWGLFVLSLSTLAAAFLTGLIIGGEAIASGQATFPPTMLPGLLWGGQATGKFVTIYSVTTSALWVCAIATLGWAFVSALRERDHSASDAAATDAD